MVSVEVPETRAHRIQTIYKNLRCIKGLNVYRAAALSGRLVLFLKRAVRISPSRGVRN